MAHRPLHHSTLGSRVHRVEGAVGVFIAKAQHGCHHPGVQLRANLKSISHRCHFEVASVWELTPKTIHLPLGCLQVGTGREEGGMQIVFCCYNTHPPRIAIGT